MKRKRLFLVVMAIFIMCMGMISGALTVKAEAWEKPVYAYGDGLYEDEIEPLAQGLGYELSELEMIILHESDLRKYIDRNESLIMYSSAILVKQKQGFGVEVRIKTPELITEVTEKEYENAMITAGVTDMLVLIDTPITATGHSALTGIYKAHDAQGEAFDKERMKVAQDELELTTEIVQEHQENNEFDASKFNNSMRGMKLNIGKEKRDKVTEEIADRVVTGELKKDDLEKILSENNIQELIDLMVRYSKTSAMDDDNVKDQLKQDYDGDSGEGFFEKFMTMILDFFKSLFGSDEE